MNLFKKLKEKHLENVRIMEARRINSMFQIKERGRQLWIVYEGNYVLPCSMLKDDPISALIKIRSDYKYYHLNPTE